MRQMRLECLLSLLLPVVKSDGAVKQQQWQQQ